MRSHSELKKIFHDGWNHPGRVENCVCNTAEEEFAAGSRHDAWLRVLLEALDADRLLQVLDVGTGPGIFACCYAELGHECTGIDFSEGMVAAAKERTTRLSLPCTFLHGDAEELPFPDRVFDVVSSRHVLYTLPRPGLALRQWVRVLRPGGKLILIAEDLHNRKRRPLSSTDSQPEDPKYQKQSPEAAGRWTASRDYYRALHECPLVEHHTHIGVLWALLETAGLAQIRAFPAKEVHDARIEQLPKSGDVPHDVRMPHIVTGVKS